MSSHQERIAYKVRGANKIKKLRIKVVDSSHKLPLRVKIQFKEERVKVDLAEMLSHFGFVEINSNTKPTALFRERRENCRKQGSEAVPFGSYKEDNFYVLICDKSREEENICFQVNKSLKYIEWSQTGLGPGDIMRVEIVEYGDYRTVYLHCADPGQKYLSQIIEDYDKAFEEVQYMCEEMPPVFQPSIGMFVCAKILKVSMRFESIKFYFSVHNGRRDGSLGTEQ